VAFLTLFVLNYFIKTTILLKFEDKSSKMQRAGTADLPLHHGRVPAWLASRMARMGRAIIEAVVVEYGKEEVLKRLSDPLWFQSFGAVMGMDWHSSGITTSVVGALKRGLNPISKDLGIYVCGGRGRHSKKTPQELFQLGERIGLDAPHLVRCSRLSAKVDNTALQDGYQIYLHSFIVTDDGKWAVIQQGMNEANGYARRYHWHSEQLESFIRNPHAFVYGPQQGPILNLVDQQASPTQQGILQLTTESPIRLLPEVRKILLPRHHDVKARNVNLKRLGSILALCQEKELQDFESLLLLKGLGPRTLQSLTLVSEVIHGTPSRFDDPARYSFAHGGKDGKPFPVPLKVYDETIHTLRKAVDRAKIGFSDKQKAIKSLHKQAKQIEQTFVPNDQFDAVIEKEWRESKKYGGRTVMDDPPFHNRSRKKADGQLSLFNKTGF
jgi:hypothetical protein